MAVNSIRFSGLASGLDTEAMVKALLGTEQLKINRQKQQQTLLEWKKDAWKDMNSQVNTFFTKYVDKMRLKSTFNKTAVTVSNPSAISLDKNITIPEGNHTIEIQKMATKATVNTKSIGIDDKNKTLDEVGIVGNKEITIGINGNASVNIAISSTTKIQDLETELRKAVGELDASGNKVSNPEATVKFDTVLKGFIISSTQTGKDKSITIGGDQDALKALGIGYTYADDEDVVGTFKSDYKGTSAKVVYNGGVTVESTTNSIEINGIKFTITSETSEKITINSIKDIEGAVNFIKDFVDEYNKLIEDINTKVNAEKSRTYSPLTDEQKESMNESDITAWEKKIKDSLFSNDTQLKALRDTMRGILQDVDNGRDVYTSLSSIGITTNDWREQGKLYINEDKLRGAINENADAVIELFAGKSAEGTTIKGIGNKLHESFQSMIKGISNVKSYGSFYHDIIDREKLIGVNKQIDKLQDRYSRLENMYYARFTAMEKALSQLNSQSSWLSQQLGGM
ncbi:flagellar filament capping protein FliD [Cellulosilyticum sp. I15G10I2]|uniref:flagellar filament capping protein FliD n=1 Tax=Cellulosilyticum sp. I15G10I2 TaxID=1892843 RepID=UPI00085C3D78|nr:flagellar filament capping protein FliD [Cellulosilyticum sp. I15G10I2]